MMPLILVVMVLLVLAIDLNHFDYCCFLTFHFLWEIIIYYLHGARQFLPLEKPVAPDIWHHCFGKGMMTWAGGKFFDLIDVVIIVLELFQCILYELCIYKIPQ